METDAVINSSQGLSYPRYDTVSFQSSWLNTLFYVSFPKKLIISKVDSTTDMILNKYL